jgi:hypothetical protein
VKNEQKQRSEIQGRTPRLPEKRMGEIFFVYFGNYKKQNYVLNNQQTQNKNI